MTSEKDKAYQKAWRARNKEKIKEYNKNYGPKWFQENKERLREVRRKWRHNNREKARAYSNNFFRKNRKKIYAEAKEKRKLIPEKELARRRAMYAITNGDLIRPEECSLCGETEYRIEAHHVDYTKPLEVIWLCAKCHHNVHSGNIKLNKNEDTLYQA